MAKAVKSKIVLEVGDQKIDVHEISKKALEDCKDKNKQELKDFHVYIKPEDGKAYYTANENQFAGNVDLYLSQR